MNVPPTRAVLEKTAASQVALPTIVPLMVAAGATEVTLVVGGRYGWDSVPLVLVGWCVMLLGSGAWLNQVLSHRVKTFLPFLAGIVAILSLWLWPQTPVPFSALFLCLF